MAIWFTSILTIVMTISTQVLGSGVFEIELHHFHNTRALLANGHSCSSMTGCRTYFRVCLKNFQTVVSPGKCIFGQATTPVLGTDSFSIPQDARLRLPLNFTWPGAFSLVIEAWYSPDADQPGETTNPEFLISSFAVHKQLGIGREWSQEVQNVTQTELRYSYRFICNDNYYGDTCSKICAPRDDRFGHYTCKSDGQIACLPGWKGEYCQEPVCLEGCNEKNGNCTIPGECKCREGWQGLFCDVCKPHPTCKHGTCKEPWQCTCKEGWGGIFCDQDLNYCTHHKPCANGARCMNTGQGSYTCTCPPGFSGVNCEEEEVEEEEVTECDSQPCRNGGSCRDSQSGYQCECPKGFTGRQCEDRVNACANTTCFFGGKCREMDDGLAYMCECPAGYTGSNCEKKVDRCTSMQCGNGGHCVMRAGRPQCSCLSGFRGSRCEININECARSPCANGATCVDGINHYTCVCPPGYGDRHCDRPTSRCASRPCLNGGTCVATDGQEEEAQPVCVCPENYGGPRCQLRDAASPSVGPQSEDRLSLAAVGLGVGLVAALVFGCMAATAAACHVRRRRRRRRDKERDAETMNNLSKGDFQRENLISTLELKNNNKKVELEADRPGEKSNRKHVNHLDYNTSARYKDESSVSDKDDNCEKTIEEKKRFARTYSKRPECRISTISSSRDSMYQSVFVIAEEKNECIIATEV